MSYSIVIGSWTRKHPTITLLLSGLLVALVAVIDSMAGFACNVAAVYLLPVVLVTWLWAAISGYSWGLPV
jgi:hypothetical protein